MPGHVQPAMMALLLRPTRGGGRGGSSDPPAGSEGGVKVPCPRCARRERAEGQGRARAGGRRSAMSDAQRWL